MGKQFPKENWDGTNRAGRSKARIMGDNKVMHREAEHGALLWMTHVHEIKLRRIGIDMPKESVFINSLQSTEQHSEKDNVF